MTRQEHQQQAERLIKKALQTLGKTDLDAVAQKVMNEVQMESTRHSGGHGFELPQPETSSKELNFLDWAAKEYLKILADGLSK